MAIDLKLHNQFFYCKISARPFMLSLHFEVIFLPTADPHFSFPPGCSYPAISRCADNQDKKCEIHSKKVILTAMGEKMVYFRNRNKYVPLDPKLSLEADPLSKWGVRHYNSSTYSPKRGSALRRESVSTIH